jgi:hypothetical protein
VVQEAMVYKPGKRPQKENSPEVISLSDIIFSVLTFERA